MSKTQFYAASPSDDLFQHYQYEFTVDVHSSSSVTLLDGHGGKITLSGNGIVFDADKDMIQGTVTSVSFGNVDGAVFAKSTGNNIRVASLDEDDSGLAYVDFLEAIHTKNDVILGSNEADYLYGLNGSDRIDGRGGNDNIFGDSDGDRLTGGKGSDQFSFTLGSGKVVVTDFDAVGGGDKQDYLYAYGNPYTVKKKGDDLVVTIDNDTQVVLLSVSKKDFDAGDFMI